MLVTIPLIIGGWVVVSILLAFFLGKEMKKAIEEDENNLHEPIHDKRYENKDS